jgi:hypothetical protein
MSQQFAFVANDAHMRTPAPDRELVLWSWMTGALRPHRPLAELVHLQSEAAPSPLLLVLGVPARQSNL